MNKKRRMILYVLSVILVIFVVVCIIKKEMGNESQSVQTDAQTTENVQENQEYKETEAVNASSEADPEIEAETETKQEMDVDTTLLFTGDVLFSDSFQSTYNASGIAGVLSSEVLAQLQQADITMVNEEFPFSNRGTPMEDKQYTFRTDPSYVSALTEMGVDIVSLANNHVLDYGRDALTDTFTTLEGAGILYAGAGENADRAKALQTIEVNGKTFGFLAASRVLPVEGWNAGDTKSGVLGTYDSTALVQAIQNAKNNCDFLTVFVHWGVEHNEYPETYQTNLAHQYIDAGADAVIGAHTHCLQGITYYNNKPIFYSLGNFIFGSSIDQTMVVKLTVDENNNAICQLIAAKASAGCTSIMDDTEALELYQYVESISDGISISKQGVLGRIEE